MLLAVGAPTSSVIDASASSGDVVVPRIARLFFGRTFILASARGVEILGRECDFRTFFGVENSLIKSNTSRRP